MTTITQLPGNLDIRYLKRHDISVDMDFNISLVGYTFVAKVNANVIVTPTVTNIDLSTGKINFAIPKASIIDVIPNQEFAWYLDGVVGDITLPLLAGVYCVSEK